MLDTALYENSMFDTPQARAALVADGKLCTELFFINYLGFLGLYALNDSRGYMKTYEQTEKKLKINEIADDNHDASLVIKLCVESGVLAEAKTVQVTKLLALIKQRTVRSKDIDGVRIRALIEQTMLHVKPMAAPVKTVVDAFMAGTIDIKEFARQIYEVAKNNVWRPYTNEFRTLVLKGQYTDYFTVMKRGATVSPPANQTAAPAAANAATPATAAPAPAPTTPKGPTPDDFKKAVEDAVAAANGAGSAAVSALTFFAQTFPMSNSDTVATGIKNAIENLPLAAFKDGWRRGDDRRRFAAELELRAMEYAASSKDWLKVKVEPSFSFGSMAAPSADILGKAKEIVSGAVKSFGIPTDANFESWQALSLIYLSLYRSNKDREDDLASLIKPGDAEHNIHLKALLATSSYGAAHLLDAGTLSPKAAAWVRKYGGMVRGTQLVVSAAMTSTIWAKIGIDDRILWLAANWNSEGARKVSGFLRGTRVTPNISAASQSAREKAIATIDRKWADATLMQQMYAAATPEGSNFFMSLAAAAAASAMVAARKPLEVPEIMKIYFNLDEPGKMTHEVGHLLDYIGSLPISTAAEADVFAGFMKQITNARSRRTIRSSWNINLASNDVRASGVQWMGWSYFHRYTPDGVISTSGDVIRIDPAKTSAAVGDWIRQFGENSLIKVKFIETKNSKKEFALAVLGALTVPDMRDMNYIVDASVIEEVKAMNTSEWYELVKEMWETDRRPDMFKIQQDYFYSLVVGEHLDASKFPGLIKAVSRFVTNEISFDDSRNMSSYYINTDYLVAPLTAEKVKIVKNHLKSQLRYNGGNASYDTDEVAALFDSGIEANLFDADSADVAASIARVVLANDADRYGDAVQKAMDAGIDALKPVIAAIGATKPLGGKAFPSYRWAWGIDGAKMTEILKEINTNLATDAAAGKYSPGYDPVRIPTNNPAIESRVDPDFMAQVKSMYNTFVASYEKPVIVIAPWIDEIDLSELKPAPAQPLVTLRSVRNNLIDLRRRVTFLQGASKTDEAARAFIQPVIEDIKAGRTTRLDGFALDILVEIGKEYGISDSDLRACVAASFKHYADSNAKPVDYADFAEELQKNANDYVSTEDMAFIVKKLTSSESKACQEAIVNMAYTSTSNGAVSKSFIEAVRAAGNERSVVNRLRKTSIIGQAVARINGDPNGVRIDVTPARMNEFLKYNDVDVTAVGTVDVKRLEDFGQLSDELNAVIPPLALTEDTSPGARRQRINELHKNNRYNHDPALGLEVKRVFTVNLPGQRDRFDAWVANNPRTKIVTLYHGTGTYAAQFLLRCGFRIIKSTDGSVTGRMLGDGIYFADNINKSMLYMSNKGYIRQAGQEGYVFKCKVALGERPQNHREGYAERSSLVSNEWAIFSTDQIVIEEAYHGVSRRRHEIQLLLTEAATAYSPSVSTFMFMDGMIPLGNDMLTDFSKLPKFGAHVTIETSAKGPIINIRHDRTVAPVDRCYRYGEELYAASRAEELKQFLELLQNRY